MRRSRLGMGSTLVLALLACNRGDEARTARTGARASEPTTGPAAVVGAGADSGGTLGFEHDPEPAPNIAVEIPERPPVEPVPAPDPSMAGDCPDRNAREVGIIVSPRRPVAGEPVHVLAATLDSEAALALRIEDAEGATIAVQSRHRGGPPVSAIASFDVPEGGSYRVIVGRAGQGLRCKKFWAAPTRQKRSLPEPDLSRVWESKLAWDGAEEALYSAWVRELFHAPPGEDLAFSALDELTSDPKRNLLFDYFGWREDHRTEGLTLNPDCADTPYFLRAYFAWKRGLPFGFRTCSRGHGSAPQCFDLRTTDAPPSLKETWADGTETYDHLKVIDRFFRRTLAWGVHTGNGRTAYGDANTDLYPVRLDRRGLRPGIVYADPYGHIFVLVEVVEQQGSFPGILYAIDGQPDGSITRKRFWEGNFLWNPDPSLGGSGFKAFRPLMKLGGADGVEAIVSIDDATLRKRKDYADVSDEQAKLDADAFYDQVERLINPRPRDPMFALTEAVVALAEAARVRVTSVQNGVDWHAAHPDELIEMPWGHDVFETVGAWENFSTPARDLRLLIAMDVIAKFEDKIRRQPDAYGLAPGPALDAAVAELVAAREQLLARPEFAITYVDSDGGEVTLTLAQLFTRAAALEVAYNPNDCPEVRWGAPESGPEAAKCKRRAPEDQQLKMKAYRPWFAARQRPGRGDPGPDVPGVERPPPEDE